MNLKLNLSIVNALWFLLTGERFSLDDPKLKAIVSKIDAMLRLESGLSAFSQLMQVISPKLTKKFNKGFEAFNEIANDIKGLVVPNIQHHRSTMDPDHPRDFMDAYLQEINQTRDPHSSFYGRRGEESLIATIMDLFLAGIY